MFLSLNNKIRAKSCKTSFSVHWTSSLCQKEIQPKFKKKGLYTFCLGRIFKDDLSGFFFLHQLIDLKNMNYYYDIFYFIFCDLLQLDKWYFHDIAMKWLFSDGNNYVSIIIKFTAQTIRLFPSLNVIFFVIYEICFDPLYC